MMKILLVFYLIAYSAITFILLLIAIAFTAHFYYECKENKTKIKDSKNYPKKL